MPAGLSTKIVPLSGAYIIDRASDLARELSAALALARVIEVDLSEATELDLSAVQALYAAARSAGARGGGLRLAGSLRPELVERLAASGFARGGERNGAELAASLPDFPHVERGAP